MGQEKRRRSRVCAQFEAYAYLDGEKIPLYTNNLSLKGALFGPEPRLAAGQECNLIFTLSKDVNVRIKARVVRSDAEGTAVDFESMDETAFYHLHNMADHLVALVVMDQNSQPGPPGTTDCRDLLCSGCFHGA